MYTRISRYYPGHDGTKLAVDLYIPGTEEKVPVLFRAVYGERRPQPEDERANAFFETTLKQYEYFLDRGYAVCVMEPRGIGASFGLSEGFWSPKDGKDIAAVIDSVAAEEFCNGSVGMFGGSNMGACQHFAAVNQPKALKCIVPCDCSADLYYQNYPNGVSILPETKHRELEVRLGIPVDEDPAPDYPLAHAALAEHRLNLGFLEQYRRDMHRDDVNPVIGYAPNLEIPAWEKMNNIRFSGISSYAYGSFFDPGCTSKVFEFRSFGGKLLLGPWRHMEVYAHSKELPEQDFPWEEDHLAFFDRVLKGIDNDCLSEPPVRYYTMGDPEPWHRSADFPPDSQTNPCLRLTAEGGLVDGPAAEGSIDYRVREDIEVFEGMGRLNRRITKDMAGENAKCVTFATEPLPKDLEITGFPVLTVFVTSTAKDGAFLALLEEETPDGVCRVLTDGCIRGRSGKLGRNAVTDALGVPFHSSLRRDDMALSGSEPVQLDFHLEVCSYLIKRGSRLRIALYCGGTHVNQPSPEAAKATVTFHFGGDCDSYLKLPVIAPNATVFRSTDETVYAFKRAVYREKNGRFTAFPCIQVYPEDETVRFVTEAFTAVRRDSGLSSSLTIEEDPSRGVSGFSGLAEIPDRMTFSEKSTEIVKPYDQKERRRRRERGEFPDVTYRNLWVATVPVSRGEPGRMNPKLQNTMDIFADLALPEGSGPFPCVVCIHGFGGDNHTFEPIARDLLAAGIAVAGVDYRLMPPDIWPSSGEDVRACVRYLKAHAEELSLDPERFGLAGESMGGHLTAMLAAVNGKPEEEGSIGGNLHVNCSVKAGVALFAPTDLLNFGEDCLAQWPGLPEKVAYGDGPYAGCAAFIGYMGPGKGLGELKLHRYEKDTEEAKILELAREASPICHVTKASAPLCLVHGIADCGIQVPMGQSLRMFDALTRAGVKSLVLLNNLGFYGDDPEVRLGMVDFLRRRLTE